MLRHAARINDYYWLISRILESSTTNPSNMNLAIQLGENIRARELSNEIFRPKLTCAEPVDPIRENEVRRIIADYTHLRNESKSPHGNRTGEARKRLLKAESLKNRVDSAHSLSRLGLDLDLTIERVQEKLGPNEAMLVFFAPPAQTLDGEKLGSPGALMISTDSAQWIQLESDRTQLGRLARAQKDASLHGDDLVDSMNRRILTEHLQPLTLSPPVSAKLSPRLGRLAASN